jgi:hypothetical protein
MMMGFYARPLPLERPQWLDTTNGLNASFRAPVFPGSKLGTPNVLPDQEGSPRADSISSEKQHHVFSIFVSTLERVCVFDCYRGSFQTMTSQSNFIAMEKRQKAGIPVGAMQQERAYNGGEQEQTDDRHGSEPAAELPASASDASLHSASIMAVVPTARRTSSVSTAPSNSPMT